MRLWQGSPSGEAESMNNVYATCVLIEVSLSCRIHSQFPSTEENLANKLLTDTDRKYVVQTLATVLMTQIQRPSMKDCQVVAQSLIAAHPFLKDDEGDGEV